MSGSGFALFDTAIGRCAIAWSERGIAGVQLPEASDAETRGRVGRRVPRASEAEPPAEVGHAIEGMIELLAGRRGPATDLAFVTLDLKGSAPFECRVFAAARTIVAGEISTYGEIARRIGDPGSARAVGRALGRNPFPLVVPCHRVLAAGGAPGGFSATGGVALKLRLLAIEGARGLPVGGLFD